MNDKVVEKAREYIGTPFVHQGRVRNYGIDCIGLVVAVAHELGIPVEDQKVYPRRPDGRLQQELRKQMREVSKEDLLPGDVLFFKIGEWEHVGIYTGKNLIHVHQTKGKCIEHIYDNSWKKHCIGAYRWPS